MHPRPSAFPPPKALALPVKDALRGIRKTSQRSRAFLSSWVATLPPPISSVPRLIVGEVDWAAQWAEQTTRSVVRSVDPTLVSVSSGLAAIADTRDPEIAFAEAVYRGLQVTLPAFERTDLMISQTLAAVAYGAAAEAVGSVDEADFAAELMARMADHHVVGVAPGTPIGLDAADVGVIRLATFATMLWLLAERDTPQDDEAEMKSVCVHMTFAIREEVLAATDGSALAALLRSYREVV